MGCRALSKSSRASSSLPVGNGTTLRRAKLRCTAWMAQAGGSQVFSSFAISTTRLHMARVFEQVEHPSSRCFCIALFRALPSTCRAKSIQSSIEKCVIAFLPGREWVHLANKGNRGAQKYRSVKKSHSGGYLDVTFPSSTKGAQ